MSIINGPSIKRSLLAGGVAFAAVLAAFVVEHNSPSARAQPAGVAVEQPAVPVTVHTLIPEKLRLWSEFSGRLAAVDYAEIRPEVSGRITEVRIRDGQTVRAGDVIFVIDPRPFEAALARAEANLVSARNNADYAQVELARATVLTKSQAIAQRIYDQDANQKRVADAAVLAAEAELKQAQVDLDHAYVKAPITGRVSRAEITVGNVVQAGPNAPVLTSIVSNDGIYADFDVDEQTYLQSVRNSADTLQKEEKIPVRLNLQGDNGNTYIGTIYSFDNRINTSSGTIRARAKFQNAGGKLIPGMFVVVKLGSADEREVLTVADRAIGHDQNKTVLLVVGNDNKVQFREVVLGHQIGGRHVVLSGVKAGDRVIVDGIQHVQPGMPVAPKEDVAAPVSGLPSTPPKAG
jgi:multidrug efflux system membrane fusion protein